MKKIGKVLCAIVLLGYLLAVVLESDLWGNILSPIVILGAAFVTYYGYFMKEEERQLKLAGILISISLFTWGIADILWGYFESVLHLNVDSMLLFIYGYGLTNLFLTIGVCIYGFYMFRNWNWTQVLLDSLITSLCIMIVIWVVFFNMKSGNVLSVEEEWSSFFSIITDVVILIWMAVWYLSIRKGKIPLYLKVLFCGLALFGIVDLIYFYQIFFTAYNDNSILDGFYAMSFISIAASAIFKIQEQRIMVEDIDNIGESNKGLVLLVFPFIIVITKGIVVEYLLYLVSGITIYLILTSYIQKNIYRELLFKQELELNNKLEKLVDERTSQLIRKNVELDRMLSFDYTTGLYNRRYFIEKLDDIILKNIKGQQILILYIDLNKYKMLKTMFGNYVGDEVLSEIGGRLKSFTDSVSDSFVCTMGEDHFAWAYQGNLDYKDAEEYARKLIQVCSDIYQIEGYELRITVNVGISIFPFDAKDRDEMIKHSDMAMTQSRTFGFNRFTSYEAQFSEKFQRKNRIEIMLKKVQFDKEFSLHYQPQVRTQTQELVGFEALLRWHTPADEWIPPFEVVSIAEETGYITAVGDWVLKTALKQLREWNRVKNHKLKMGINVSMKQLVGNHFLAILKSKIEKYDLDPKWIDIEITETIQMDMNLEVLKIFASLREMGVSISIDDFGTGYSSLSYLKHLPIDRIKIAKNLVDHIDKDQFDFQIVKSVIQIARVKGIIVIAEGVETKEQYLALKELDCDEIQGFFFGTPMEKEQVEDFYKL